MDKQTESLEAFKKWWNEPEQAELRISCAEGWGFRTWVASRESLVVEIASHTEFEIEHMISPEKEGYSLGWIDGRNYAVRQVEKIGIRIKGEGV